MDSSCQVTKSATWFQRPVPSSTNTAFVLLRARISMAPSKIGFQRCSSMTGST